MVNKKLGENRGGRPLHFPGIVSKLSFTCLSMYYYHCYLLAVISFQCLH